VIAYLLQPGIAIRDPSDSIMYCLSLSWEQGVYHRRHKAPWWDIVAGEVAHWNSMVSVCVGRRAADAQTPAHEEIVRNRGRVDVQHDGGLKNSCIFPMSSTIDRSNEGIAIFSRY
jgi:hypothetical protein